MIRKVFELEGTCGEMREAESSWEAVRHSGQVFVYLRYDPERGKHFWNNPGEYVFGITAKGRQVNVCAIRSEPWVPQERRREDAFYDEAARWAVQFTIWEMERDAAQPGMLSGLSAEAFGALAGRDEDSGEIEIRRPGVVGRRHR